MRRRRTLLRECAELRVLYPVSTLARIGNVDVDLMRRLLRSNGVRFVRLGRALFVCLLDVQRKIPPLWESLCLVEQVRGRRS
jgi:hypothetical protein